MTKTQIRFYNMLKNQMVDFEEAFHKEFMINRIEQIADDDLKYLLEDINLDKDKLSRKGYITYAKFIHYADKLLERSSQKLLQTTYSKKVEELYTKRNMMLQSLEINADTLLKRNQLIKDIEEKN